MNLRQIETFLAVYEASSFSAGAVRLKMSQPTASKLIDGLEQELGYKLFLRTGARISPTPQAQTLYGEMARVKLGFEHLVGHARELKSGAEGRVVIGANPVLSADFVPRLIAIFARRHPRARVRLETDTGRNLVASFLAGTLDIAFGSRTLRTRQMPEMMVVPGGPLLTVPSVCVLPVGHRLANRKTLALSDIDGEAYVGMAGEPGTSRDVEELFRDSGVQVRLVAEATTPLGALALVGQGLGVTLSADYGVRALPASARVVARPIAPSFVASIEYQVSDKTAHSPLVKAFADIARANAEAVHRDIVADLFAT